MKKKLIAVLLAATMAIQPLSVAGAAEFTDGEAVSGEIDFDESDEKLFDSEEIFADDEEIACASVGDEGDIDDKPENAELMGDHVWVEFDDTTKTATISGTGEMWDYYENGYDYSNTHKNPFIGKSGVKNIVIGNNITYVSKFLLKDYDDRYLITGVSLGNSVKKIGDRAFEYCNNLLSITLPDSLEEIGTESFIGCGFENLVIPDSVTKVGTQCFSGCNNLKTAILSENLTNIPDYMFSHCSSLETVTMSNNISKIGDRAFIGTALINVNLPSKLQYIGYDAFQDCDYIFSISLPASLKEIGANAFGDCSRLSNVFFENGFICNISSMMFNNCENLQTIEIPGGVSYIYNEAFGNCTKLQEIIIPQTVTSIDDNAFSGCDNLTIKGYTGSTAERFASEHNINFVTLGEMEEELRLSNAFSGWYNRQYYKMYVRCTTNKKVSYYCTYVARDADAPVYDATRQDGTANANQQICIDYFEAPDEEINIYIFATDIQTGNYTSIKIVPDYGERPAKPVAITWPVNIGSNITASLEDNILTLTGSGSTYDYELNWDEEDEEVWTEWADKESLSRVNKIVIGDGITRLGDYVFAGCVNLQEIKIPEGVTSIGEGIVYKCNALTSITFPSTLETISCFSRDGEGLPNLRSVILPEGIVKISQFAFCHYPNLKYISIPSTVTQIGEGAFDYSGFVEITLPSNIGTVPYRAFEGDTLLKHVSIADGVRSIEKYAFRECTQLQGVSIPESVTDIDPEAFYGCPNVYIKGKSGSYAEQYANDYRIPFRSGDYKVIFKDNGRTVDTQYINAGENATPPTLSPKDGYTLSWDGDYTNIQEDMIINAVWTKKDSGNTDPPIIVYPPETTKYTVTFVDRGKTIKTEKVESGKAADYPFVYRYGYDLIWDKDFSKVTSNMTVNAVWTVIKPEKVTGLAAVVQPKTIQLSWDEAEYARYYMLYRKADNEKEFKQIGKTTRILWTDRKAEQGKTYQYKVSAMRSVSGTKYEGEASDIVTTKLGEPKKGDVYSVGALNYLIMNDNEVRVTGAARSVASIYIPAVVNVGGKQFKVTSIDHKAFYKNADIMEVKIGSNVTYIGKYSFYQCPNLESVRFGSRVQTISTCAFTQCPELGNVILPASVKRLGAKAFYQCTSMKQIQINSSALEYLGQKALAVNKTVTIKLPKAKYTAYRKRIKDSVAYSKTKYVKM